MISKKIINKFLKKINVEIHGSSYLQALRKGEFRHNEFDLYKKIFSNKAICIFDVGANRGIKAAEYMQHFPKATVHAFEPYLPCFVQLQEKFAGNKNIYLYNIGISNEKAMKAFHVNKSIDTNSFLSSAEVGLNSDAFVKTIEEIVLPLDTMDSVAKDNNIEHIHILKLDVQGSELNALKGAENLLATHKIDVLFIETYFIQQYKGQPLFYEIAAYLVKLGYVLQDFYNPIYGHGKLAWCDVIFVRKDLKC